MKKDIDLIRKILLDVEEKDKGNGRFYMPKIDDYPDEVINYHCSIMGDAGLVELYISINKTHGRINYIKGMKWYGHEFLDAARNDRVWNKAKETAKNKGIELGIDIMKELMVGITRAMIGLS